MFVFISVACSGSFNLHSLLHAKYTFIRVHCGVSLSEAYVQLTSTWCREYGKAQHGMPRGFISTRFVYPCEIIGPAHFIEFMYCRLEHATLLRVDVFHGVTLCKCAIFISRPWTSVCAWNGESKPIYECAHGMVCAQTFFSRGICIAAAKIVNGTCFL